MIEVRSFGGGAAELARFNQRVWASSYGGSKTISLWDEAFFDWQLLSERPEGRDYLLAAYRGQELLGTLLSEAIPLRLFGRDINASYGGWLSVDPDCRRQGIGTRLFEALRQRHLERAEPFQIGLGYRGAMGPKFWRQFPNNTVCVTQLGVWARVLDRRAVSEWDLHWSGRVGTRLLRWIQHEVPEPEHTTGIRRYQDRDLERCQGLTARLLEQVDLGIAWQRERLSRQLDYRGFPRTFVLETDGRVSGMINYHPLEMQSRGVINTAVIDLVVFDDIPLSEKVRFLRAVLREMASEGIKLTLLLASSGLPNRALLLSGFLPRPRQFDLLCVRMDESFEIGKPRRANVLWR